MKVLITGASGYIGRNLTRLFAINTEFDVLSLSKNTLNLLDKPSIIKVLYDFNPNVIIHTANVGGDRLKTDPPTIIKDNVEMFENLVELSDDRKIITFGSGSEFDVRREIKDVLEENFINRFPVDPYAVSKHIISRQSLLYKRVSLLRLFGCFNHDEENFRFIKSCIINSTQRVITDIEVNKWMDFFYMDDVYTVIKHVINNPSPIHMNLVYKNKHTLLSILNYISTKIVGSELLLKKEMGMSYTGNGDKLDSLNLNLIGLEEGICRTIHKLT